MEHNVPSSLITSTETSAAVPPVTRMAIANQILRRGRECTSDKIYLADKESHFYSYYPEMLLL